MTPIIEAKTTRKHSANPLVDLWFRLRYAVARTLRRTASWVSPDNF